MYSEKGKSAKCHDMTPAYKCNNPNSHRNWNITVNGWDAGMNCHEECLKQVPKFGDGCCEAKKVKVTQPTTSLTTTSTAMSSTTSSTSMSMTVSNLPSSTVASSASISLTSLTATSQIVTSTASTSKPPVPPNRPKLKSASHDTFCLFRPKATSTHDASIKPYAHMATNCTRKLERMCFSITLTLVKFKMIVII